MGGTYYNEETSTFIVSKRVSLMIYFFMFRLILCSAWLGTTFTVGIAFMSLSSKEQKKTYLFRLQCLCVVLATIYNASEVGNVLYRLKILTFRSDQVMNYTAYTHWTSFGHSAEHLIPLLSDSALLFRISSFFPYPVYSKRFRFLLLTPFFVLIVCRTILGILMGVFFSIQWLTGIVWRTDDPLPYHHPPNYSVWGYCYVATLELSMGSLFCTLASAILLFKAHQLAKSHFSVNNKKRINARMRFFAEALMMCFIPPIFLNIAAPIQLMPPVYTGYTYFRESETLLVNLSVICSILATSWSNIREDWSSNSNQTYVSNFDKKTLTYPDQLHGITINTREQPEQDKDKSDLREELA